MKQTEALDEARKLFPEIADHISVERNYTIGFKHGIQNQFYIWDHSNRGARIVAHSDRSWEHALAIAKSGNEDIWPEDATPIDDEVEA